jgi:hypothetical protein
VAQQTTSFNQYSEQPFENQHVALRLNGAATVTNLEQMKRTFISISLSGTNVAADHRGIMTYDRKDKRGYFCDQVDVRMSLDAPGYHIAVDGPQTTMGSVSTTSSAQLQLDVNAGTFGPVPTTGVSAGIAIGQSFTASLADWRVVNNSENTFISHSYRMAASNGGLYKEPADLVDTTPGGQLEGTPLFSVPDISISNMPLLSTGIFVSDELEKDDVTLTVSITGWFVWVEKTFEFFDVKIDSARKPWTWEYSYRIGVPQAD